MATDQQIAPDQTQWGMIVDVDRCTGCKACVIACRSENNVAIVGAKQCAMQRLMDWLRIERMYEGHYPHVHVDFIPMLCQQCGTAPCESVCPVFASVHTLDGLNAQVYNRCVGTRVCANNCPYHVRQFNYIQPKWPAPMDMMLNPDVSVRNEGVMEKCTFCVQRIRRGLLDAKVRGQVVQDGEIRPACVESCASEALVFGNLSDPESTINKVLDRNRHRSVLVHNEHDTRPNVIYLRPDRDPDALDPLEPATSGAQAESHGEPARPAARQPEASPTPAPEATPAAQATPAAAATPQPTPVAPEGVR